MKNYRRCVQCDTLKPLDDFLQTYLGYTSHCRDCIESQPAVRGVSKGATKVASVMVIALMLAVLVAAPIARATTGNGGVWNIQTLNGLGANTTTFGPHENITIIVQPLSIAVPGGRSVEVLGFNGSVLSNYYLGFFNIANTSGPKFNVTFAISQYNLQAGGIISVVVVNNLNGDTEASVSVSVSTDFNYLLALQWARFLVLLTGQTSILDGRITVLENEVVTLTSYVQMLAIALAMLAVYATRDTWMRREKKQVKEEETLLGAMMRQYILERIEYGDREQKKAQQK